MSSIPLAAPPIVWKLSGSAWIGFAVIAGLLYWVFMGGVHELWRVWMDRPEYSFGIFIPILSAFLIWQRKDRLERMRLTGDWSGLALIIFALALRYVGDLATSAIIVEYALVFAIFGVVVCAIGWAGFRALFAPLMFLFFMIQLPEFVLQGLSQRLQIISSHLGVAFIRACDISVYLEGNIIDLGSMKLQVAEACSGLRYLFSLLVLGFIAAYFFKGAFWKRALIFLSSIPITILMNSFRIGLVGVTVEYWGRGAAEGVLHDFEGFVIFMGCTAILLAEMWVLAHIGRGRTGLQAAFGLDLPAPTPAGARVTYRGFGRPLAVAAAVLAIAALAASFAPKREPLVPERENFRSFPMKLGDYEGRPDRIEPEILRELKANDYLLVDYFSATAAPVNLYVQWYDAQTTGTSTHSPRLCIPAGGWEIARLDRHTVPEVDFNGRPLEVNRVVITRGEQTLLVWYWFQQRGRNTTNEYATKLLIFWDSLRTNRSDGSMVRIVTALRPLEKEAAGDARLARFAKTLAPALSRYIPE
jgi:exosortase D (VPLPA-CTERM-specific)